VAGSSPASASQFGPPGDRKKSPRGCDARALEVINSSSAQCSVTPSESQAETRCPRISARAFNRLRDVEERIALLGRAVSSGEAHPCLVVPRLLAALAAAGFDEEAPR
jgi:hypothetical protein